jgi:hypothetical protein
MNPEMDRNFPSGMKFLKRTHFRSAKIWQVTSRIPLRQLRSGPQEWFFFQKKLNYRAGNLRKHLTAIGLHLNATQIQRDFFRV